MDEDNSLIRPVTLLLALSLIPSTTQAYVDPGSGALLLQVVLSIVIGIGVYFRRVREAVSHLFRRVTGRGTGASAASSRDQGNLDS